MTKKERERQLLPGMPNDVLFAAIEAHNRAYAPYSQYAVGAAVMTGSGEVIAGCNVENASYGLTICAERVAVARAVSDGHREFKLLVVATADAAPPCGACLQFLCEFCEDLDIRLVSRGVPPKLVETRLSALLPHRFRSAKIRSP